MISIILEFEPKPMKFYNSVANIAKAKTIHPKSNLPQQHQVAVDRMKVGMKYAPKRNPFVPKMRMKAIPSYPKRIV